MASPGSIVACTPRPDLPLHNHHNTEQLSSPTSVASTVPSCADEPPSPSAVRDTDPAKNQPDDGGTGVFIPAANPDATPRSSRSRNRRNRNQRRNKQDNSASNTAALLTAAQLAAGAAPPLLSTSSAPASVLSLLQQLALQDGTPCSAGPSPRCSMAPPGGPHDPQLLQPLLASLQQQQLGNGGCFTNTHTPCQPSASRSVSPNVPPLDLTSLLASTSHHEWTQRSGGGAWPPTPDALGTSCGAPWKQQGRGGMQQGGVQEQQGGSDPQMGPLEMWSFTSSKWGGHVEGVHEDQQWHVVPDDVAEHGFLQQEGGMSSSRSHACVDTSSPQLPDTWTY